MTKRLFVLGSALLMIAGCWSKGPTETVPEQKTSTSQSLPPGGSSAGAHHSPVREITAGKYRVKLDLAAQILRLDLEKQESWRTADGEIRADDTVTVVPPSADVLVADQVVARVEAGRALSVSGVQGDFVGVSVLADGKPVSGWMRRQDVAFKANESKLEPTLASIPRSEMLPAAMLVQKAKAFDDGLYAAVELAAQEGAGNFAGKRSMLSALVGSVLQSPIAEQSPLVLLAGAKLGGVVEHLPTEFESAVAGKLADFERNPVRSRPIGFYTWSPELERVFQQDRMLQTPLESDEAETLAAALTRDSGSRAPYEAYLELVSRLTNPPAERDLRFLLKDGAAGTAGREPICFFPPSRSFEGDLFRRLIGPGAVPDDFNLMDELIAQARSGKLSLAPTASSGWYDYTAWALEPMIMPEKVEEAKWLDLSESYREHLTELFKGTLALARETHTKQLAGAGEKSVEHTSSQRPQFTIKPELTAEPLATSYLRRAQGYRFLAKSVESTFGRQALEGMHRLTQAGPVTANLSAELASMEELFLGAAAVVGRQLGMKKFLPDELESRAEPAARAFIDWSADPSKDTDLAGDLRMMVPVYVDPQNQRIKVWVLLGWTQKRCEVSFAQRPAVEIIDAAGKPLEADGYDVQWTSAWDTLATPVVAELYVTQLLNRDAFRKHCDTYWTPAAILANLK